MILVLACIFTPVVDSTAENYSTQGVSKTFFSTGAFVKQSLMRVA